MGLRGCGIVAGIFTSLVVVAIAAPAAQAQLAGHTVHYRHTGAAARWLDADGQPLPFESDDEILDFLRTAEIVSTESIPVGITKPKKLLLARNGLRVHAVFRNVDVTRERVRLSNGHFYMRLRDYGLFEVAAYRLAGMLGYDNVPPAVVRSIGATKGSLQLWVEQAMPESARRDKGVQPPNHAAWLQQMQDMHLFDYLITNIDRNLGNYLMGRTGKLWMIDHTRAFQMHVADWTPDNIWFVDQGLWRRLRRLDREMLQARLGDVLSEFEIDVLMARIDAFAAHIRAHIARRGAAAVVTPERHSGGW